MISPYQHIDTPALLIDEQALTSNIKYMQDYADKHGVKMRPHTKTHKMSYLAKLQLEAGAKGVAVAKIGEAEVFAQKGIDDIFIANEIVGEDKLKRIAELSKKITISFGIDSIFNVRQAEEVFAENNTVANVLVEIEVGENRSGVIEKSDFQNLLDELKQCSHVKLRGVFSHDGNSYHAKDADECKQIFIDSQIRTLEFAQMARDNGFDIDTVSIGSTPPFILGFDVVEGVTEVRIGTYILMDASQSNVIGTFDRCAATILTTVISKPTDERVITDAGAKSMTMQERSGGICATKGKGIIKNSGGIAVTSVYDEHGIIYSRKLHENVEIGDKIEIFPNHICPVCNLYDKAYLVSNGKIIKEVEVDARGKAN